MTGRIILVRHGQTTSNAVHRLDTEPPGAELTTEGRTQASDVGKELAEYCQVRAGSRGRIAEMICGVSIRTQQTAMLAARAIEKSAGLAERAIRVDVRTGIHEIAAGDREMHNDDESHHIYAQFLWDLMSGDPNARMGGDYGENIDDFLGRYRPVVEDLVSEYVSGQDKDVVIVSHGAAIRTFAAHATGTDANFAVAHYLPNCRFIVLEPRGNEFGQWHLVRWADLEQLP